MRKKLGDFTLHETDNAGLVLSHKTLRGTKHYVASDTTAESITALVNLALVNQTMNTEQAPVTAFDTELAKILGPLDDN